MIQNFPHLHIPMPKPHTTRRSRFLWNACLLTLASFGMRGVGMVFNIYLTTHLGAAGLGRFSLIMSVYGFAVTLASAGIGLAVTRVISEAEGTAEETAAPRTDHKQKNSIPITTGIASDTAYPKIRRAMRTGMEYSFLLGITATILLFFLSDPIGRQCLHDVQSIPALRILSLTLIPVSLSVTYNGYFVARRRAVLGAVVNAFGQLVRIFVTVFLLRMRGHGIAISPELALVFGCVMSEFVGLSVSVSLYLADMQKRKAHYQSTAAHLTLSDTETITLSRETSRGISRNVIRIAIPIAVTACIRAGLQTLLHLLIPAGLGKSGIGADAALAAYGTIHGMVLPVLLFPSAILQSAASLLIPEIAEFRAKGDKESAIRWAVHGLQITLCFAVFISGIMLYCSDAIGLLFYDSPEAGQYLRLLGAIVPVMYLDTIVDAFLKGLDEQVASMRYNIFDAAFCVVLAYVLLPVFGVSGYVLLLYASEIFNLSLSLNKLLSVTGLHFSVMQWVAVPTLAVIGASTFALWLMRAVNGIGITFRFAWVTLLVHILISGIFYGAILHLFSGFQKKPQTGT